MSQVRLCVRHRRCPLCTGLTDVIHPTASTGCTYLQCKSCDLIHAHEAAYLSPMDERTRYLEHDNTLENEGYVVMLQEFIVRTIIPFASGGKALDFGCGPGPVLAHLLRCRGFTVDVYDPFFFPCRSFLSREYDLVTSTEVFEHLKRPAEVLETLCGVIAPGGLLAIMTHLHPGADAFADWWYHRDPTHITFYSERTLEWISQHRPLELVFTDSTKMATFRRCRAKSKSRMPAGG